jgi:uncharacterized membrane protein YdbT with pleckstrin-like domain
MTSLKLNKSILILFRNILLSLAILDLIAIIILVIDFMNMKNNMIEHELFWIEEKFFLLVLLLQIIWIIYFFLRWIYSYYLLENWKLIYYYWIIFKNKKEFILNQVWSISFKQTILWKIFNYWDIIIYIHNNKYKLSWISNPEKFIKLLHYYKN